MAEAVAGFDLHAHALDPAAGVWDSEHGVRWHDVSHLTVEGRAWPVSELARPYDRLPARAEGVVREPVWDLSRYTTGVSVRFVSDTPQLMVRSTLAHARPQAAHMPPTLMSGFDLYAQTANGWRYVAVAKPAQADEMQAVHPLINQTTPEPRHYKLHMPVFSSVERVEVGIPDGAQLAPTPRYDTKPIVCYGTSIVHGACGSRPGMTYPNIHSRRLEREIYNLGFSGNGKAEPEVAALLAELDPALYMVDPLPNLKPSDVTERIEPFVGVLRDAHPDTPIVLVEKIDYPDGHVIHNKAQNARDSNANLRAAYDRLRQAGDKHLHYVPCDDLLGDDGEATVDGTHPTDLGFMRMADVFEPVLRKLL